ncbi:MAG: pentapeptide repeat-containing protein [Albidovulum sp.]|nr:pentapeptide repeat-containing protein [Albidovulum sp.]
MSSPTGGNGPTYNDPNSNPLYVLMTLHGEDQDSNRKDWNAWIGQALTSVDREAVASSSGIDPEELDRWSELGDGVEAKFKSEWQKRNQPQPCPELPDPRLGIDLSNVSFEADTPCNSKGFIFTRCSFRNCQFRSESDFSNAVFLEHADFLNALFVERASFESTEFARGARFREAKFLRGALFETVRASSVVKSFQFLGFEGAEFGRSSEQNGDISDAGSTEFRRVSFDCNTFFNGTKFYHDLVVRECEFNYNTVFTEAAFLGGLIVADTKFSRSTNFANARFMGETGFYGTVFEGTANFRSSIFRSCCIFRGGRFGNRAVFDKVCFNDVVTFHAVTFSGRCHFVETEFGSPETSGPCWSDFTDSVFMEPASFREARFRIRYPTLTGTLLHERTYFTADARCWPVADNRYARRPGFRCDRKQRIGALAAARENCAIIRHNLASQGLPDSSHFFFRREMRFAMQAASISQKILYGPYALLSDFGNSVCRPVIGFLAVVIAFAIIFHCLQPDPGPECPEAIERSLLNALSPFGSIGQYFPNCTPNQWPLLSTTQTILSYVALFLVGLGLRQRFRLR